MKVHFAECCQGFDGSVEISQTKSNTLFHVRAYDSTSVKCKYLVKESSFCTLFSCRPRSPTDNERLLGGKFINVNLTMTPKLSS